MEHGFEKNSGTIENIASNKSIRNRSMNSGTDTTSRHFQIMENEMANKPLGSTSGRKPFQSGNNKEPMEY